MWKTALWLVAISRILASALIFINPLGAAILNILILDAIDGYIAFRAGWGRRKYFLYDKILDYWWYIFIFLFMFGKPLFGIFLALFLYRTIGQILSLVTKKEEILIYFPGVLEVYFLLLLLSSKIPVLGLDYWSILVISFAIALLREYIVHVKKVSVGKKLFGLGPEWSK